MNDAAGLKSPAGPSLFHVIESIGRPAAYPSLEAYAYLGRRSSPSFVSACAERATLHAREFCSARGGSQCIRMPIRDGQTINPGPISLISLSWDAVRHSVWSTRRHFTFRRGVQGNLRRSRRPESTRITCEAITTGKSWLGNSASSFLGNALCRKVM
jgi:hypothetical protein